MLDIDNGKQSLFLKQKTPKNKCAYCQNKKRLLDKIFCLYNESVKAIHGVSVLKKNKKITKWSVDTHDTYVRSI